MASISDSMIGENEALFDRLRSNPFTGDTTVNSTTHEQGSSPNYLEPIGWVGEGVIGSETFDTTPPASPTGLTLSSDVVNDSDGSSYVRLLVSLTQPPDSDLAASHVEVTPHTLVTPGPSVDLVGTTAPTATIDTSGAHGLTTGETVEFTALAGGSGLSVGVLYWVTSTPTGTSFQVATAAGGTPITHTTDITSGAVITQTDYPVWDRPVPLFIPASKNQARIDKVQGVTKYWARVRSTDVQGNNSPYSYTALHTTVGDQVAPPDPNPPVLIAGYRGFGATWSGGDASDLAYYDLRFAQDDTAAPDGDPGAWQVVQIKGNTAFIGNLEPDLLYWVEVRAVDLSGNSSAWSDGTTASVTPVKIGASDVAFNSVITNILAANRIDADTIDTGTLKIDTGASYALGLEIYDASARLVGQWNPSGLKILEVDTARYVILDGGQIKFFNGSGVPQAAITPDGIDASKITFGRLAGGTNLIRNSSFELSGFESAPNSIVFTNTAGTPGWGASYQNVTPTANLTEGASILSITAWTS